MIPCGERHRIAASFKQLVDVGSGYAELYGRVAAIAQARIGQLRCSCGGRIHAWIEYRGWGRFGAASQAAAAFGAWSLTCSRHTEVLPAGETAPTAEELKAAGGATPEVVAQHSPQDADEIYNAADFTEPGDAGFATLSYGELISSPEAPDFEPFVRRAEGMADLCAVLLGRHSGEAKRPAIAGRTWYSVGPPHMVVVELNLEL